MEKSEKKLVVQTRLVDNEMTPSEFAWLDGARRDPSNSASGIENGAGTRPQGHGQAKGELTAKLVATK